MSTTEYPAFRERVTGRGLSSEHSVDQYVSWIGRFEEWHSGDAVDAQTLMDFDDALIRADDLPWGYSREYAYSTRILAVSAVKLYVEKMEGARIDSDVHDLCKGTHDDFDPHVLDPGEVDRVLAQECNHEGCRAARHLGYDAIMRAAEVAKVRPDDVDFDDGAVYVRAVKGSQSKWIGVDDRTLSLLEAQHQHVHQQYESPNRLFYNSRGNGWSGDSWGKHFWRNHSDAGFHSFGRHSAITNRLRRGEDLGQVFARSRHSHLQMTTRYVQFVDTDVDPLDMQDEVR